MICSLEIPGNYKRQIRKFNDSLTLPHSHPYFADNNYINIYKSDIFGNFGLKLAKGIFAFLYLWLGCRLAYDYFFV